MLVGKFVQMVAVSSKTSPGSRGDIRRVVGRKAAPAVTRRDRPRRRLGCRCTGGLSFVKPCNGGWELSPMSDRTNKVALVTGASRGIAAAGASIAISYSMHVKTHRQASPVRCDD